MPSPDPQRCSAFDPSIAGVVHIYRANPGAHWPTTAQIQPIARRNSLPAGQIWRKRIICYTRSDYEKI